MYIWYKQKSVQFWVSSYNSAVDLTPNVPRIRKRGHEDPSCSSFGPQSHAWKHRLGEASKKQYTQRKKGGKKKGRKEGRINIK